MRNALLFAVLALPALAARAQLPAYPFIHMNGSAEIFVLPDSGEIDFELTVAHADAAAGHAQVEARLAEIAAVLAAQGLDADALRPREVRKEMRKGGDPAAPLYDIKCAVRIMVADVTKWADIMAALLDKPDIDGLSATFRTAQQERIERELIAGAVRDARRKAETAAGALGRKLGEVGAVTPGQVRNVTNAIGLGAEDPTRPLRSRALKQNLLQVQALHLQQGVDMLFRIR